MFHDSDAEPARHICASNVAPVRPWEGRTLRNDFLHVMAVSAACNQQVCSGEGMPSLEVTDLPIATVRDSVPLGRRIWLYTQKRGLSDKQDRMISLKKKEIFQPCLLVRDSLSYSGFTLLDGLARLTAETLRDATTVRCFVISYEDALRTGRIFQDRLPQPSAGWRTMSETAHFYAGQGAHRVKAKRSPRGQPTPVLSRTHSSNLRKRKIEMSGVPLSLLSLTPTIAETVKGKLVVGVDLIDPSNSLWQQILPSDQMDLDMRVVSAAEGFRKKGSSAMGVQEIILILLIKKLFKKIGDLARNGLAGHTIVERSAGYKDWKGISGSLREWLKEQKHIDAYACPYFSAPINDELLRHGLEWASVGQAIPVRDLQQHCIELVREAFKALWLAKLVRKNLRPLRAMNGWNTKKHEWASILGDAADGSYDLKVAGTYQVTHKFRVLLALHGRINAAKIWRDDARNTFLYQWAIAIGDLVRIDRMIVTGLMTQEYVSVDDIRSVKENVGFPAGWSLLDELRPLIAAGKAGTVPASKELALLCWKAMHDGCGQIVERSPGANQYFKAKPLKRSVKARGRSKVMTREEILLPSILAELPVLLF